VDTENQQQFIERFNKLQQKNVLGVTAEALSLLMAYDWPGNIRELENAIERAFILCNGGYISIGHLPEDLTAHVAATVDGAMIQSAHDSLDIQAILAAVSRNGCNRTAAAKYLGIHKTTLFRKIRKLGITLPEQDGRSGSLAIQ